MALCTNPFDIISSRFENGQWKEQTTGLRPCGRCESCKNNYKKEWVTRITAESFTNPPSYFVTLTYDRRHVPLAKDGKHLSLRIKDAQAFLKALKRNTPNIQYYLASEYGGKTGRPHYHFIICGLEIDDLQKANPLLQDKEGNLLQSRKLTELWGRGNVLVAKANEATIAYTARYTFKKKDQEARSYWFNKVNDWGCEPEKQTMSRNIGMAFYRSYDKANIVEDKLYLNGRKYMLPRRFKKELRKDLTEVQYEYFISVRVNKMKEKYQK